jgi:hypothetical protein
MRVLYMIQLAQEEKAEHYQPRLSNRCCGFHDASLAIGQSVHGPAGNLTTAQDSQTPIDNTIAANSWSCRPARIWPIVDGFDEATSAMLHEIARRCAETPFDLSPDAHVHVRGTIYCLDLMQN